ncbi:MULTISPECIES: hypothetical protein [Mycolicibacterium]|uniref:Uncharacterized protein n=1 Tax=Mycolicibacterium senegalense TaxID=1796 RepID=A0A378T2V0_9MYCO|nr:MULTISPECIES: hypothetical protein [Mycolicibacterium]MCV7336412.1 hypothetical protein [Mycolicibacterium senegalense]MDR7290944.1 hypothetical protein [Mycolicibacterium senegalense]QZA22482.1 hypothetical protein K3U95_17190 [Mycolicibacterium senegalense]CDP83219.1 hypothetical protein BN975_00891 [Mycolicibacterium farcinogenes]STZ55109.1 Uncharacterised protein [Mycolicibacterium senegalense]
MATELSVNSDGLRVAAASSETAAAAALAGTETLSPTSPHPSGAGVDAINTALASLRARQANRISDQANDLNTSGIHYDTTDSDAAGAVNVLSI